MTRKRENLVHKIFVCAAIFKLGHLEYGANFKLEHYRVKEVKGCELRGVLKSALPYFLAGRDAIFDHSCSP